MLKDEIKTLYSDGDYEAVYNLWEKNKNNTINFNFWTYYYCMLSCNRLGKFKDTLEIYKVSVRNKKSDDIAFNAVSFALYQSWFKKHDFTQDDNVRLKEQIDYITQKVTYSKENPYWFILKFACDAYSNPKFIEDNALDSNFSYELLRLTDKVNPAWLSTKEHSFATDDEYVKTMSDTETWFSLRSKALIWMGKYEECIKVCEEALNQIDKFHNGNAAWFTRRKARCLYRLGKSEEAKVFLKESVIKGVKHWCIYRDLLLIAINEDDKDSAFKYIGDCCLVNYRHKSRIPFYDTAVQWLYDIGLYEEACYHRQLSNIVREERGWKPKSFSWDMDFEYTELDYRNTIKHLRKYWHKWKKIELSVPKVS